MGCAKARMACMRGVYADITGSVDGCMDGRLVDWGFNIIMGDSYCAFLGDVYLAGGLNDGECNAGM